MTRHPRYVELLEIIRTTISLFLATGEASTDEVSQAIIENNQELIAEMALPLAHRLVHRIVQAELHGMVSSNGSPRQLEFSFAKNVPDTISFVTPKTEKVAYIYTVHAEEWHLESYKEILRNQIIADRNRLQVIEVFHDALRYIFRAHPGISIEKALKIFERDHPTPPPSEGFRPSA